MNRWTIYVCTGCGGATGRHDDCDAPREAVEVVPASQLQRAVEGFEAEWRCPRGHRFRVADAASPKWCPGCGTSTLLLETTAS